MKPDNNHIFSMSTIGSGVAVRETLARVRAELRAQDVSDETCGTVEIALAEALNNIAEHAYGANDPGPIDITGLISGGVGARRLCLTLRDHGRPLPDFVMPKGDLPDNQVAFDNLPEGGFGWFLIRSLTEVISYEFESSENRLTMVFALQGPA